MTCYVDAPVHKLGRMKMSHLLADTLEELHAMARKLDLKPEYFQADASHPHYDVAMAKRARAVEFGAVELPARKQVGALVRKLKAALREEWGAGAPVIWMLQAHASPAALRVLIELYDLTERLESPTWRATELKERPLYGAEIVCEGRLAYVGERKTSMVVVNQLLRAVYLRDDSDSADGLRRYRLNSEGKRRAMYEKAYAK